MKNLRQYFQICINYYILQGEIVISACYIDNNRTRLKQEDSYRKMGMTIITNEKDSFTATKEKFWSQRFTREKLLNYLFFIKPKKYH